jgi:hypothetical protein
VAFIGPLLGLGLLLLPVVPVLAEPIQLPEVIGMVQAVSYGWGCGGHCAFNFTGESAVRVQFKEKNRVAVTDAGKLTRQENSPEGTSTDEKTWSFSFKGGWISAGGARELVLAEEKHTCQETRKTGEKTEPVECSLPQKKISLRCVKKTIKAGAASGPVEVEVLSCQPLNPEGYPGTEWPWVFGLAERVKTVKSGEPHPETHYIIE